MEDIQKIAGALEFLPTSKQPKKYEFVGGGSPGQLPAMSYTVADQTIRVVTYTQDGRETESVAEPGDIIMSGPGQENYVVKAAKFPRFYQGEIGSTIIPDQTPRMVAVYTGSDSVEFLAPWGENMVLKPGDYLVEDKDGGYYRIAKMEYESTYNPPGRVG